MLFFFPLESGLLHGSPFPRKAPCHCSGACLCLYFPPPAASSTSLRASDRVKVAIAPAPPTFPVMTQFLTFCLQATTTWACFTLVPYPQPLPSQLFTLLIQCAPSTMLSWSSAPCTLPVLSLECPTVTQAVCHLLCFLSGLQELKSNSHSLCLRVFQGLE